MFNPIITYASLNWIVYGLREWSVFPDSRWNNLHLGTS